MEDKQFSEYRRKWMENPIRYIVNPFPLNIDIESTNRCNLKCPNCARSSDSWGNNGIGDMDFHTYKKIIDECGEHKLRSIKLSWRGEPLLHPKVEELIEYAHALNMDVGLITNGGLLHKKDIKKIVDSQGKKHKICTLIRNGIKEHIEFKNNNKNKSFFKSILSNPDWA
jgi:MoaA/NifB/PqqE/SkfB family radical SAM enzyme